MRRLNVLSAVGILLALAVLLLCGCEKKTEDFPDITKLREEYVGTELEEKLRLIREQAARPWDPADRGSDTEEVAECKHRTLFRYFTADGEGHTTLCDFCLEPVGEPVPHTPYVVPYKKRPDTLGGYAVYIKTCSVCYDYELILTKLDKEGFEAAYMKSAETEVQP